MTARHSPSWTLHKKSSDTNVLLCVYLVLRQEESIDGSAAANDSSILPVAAPDHAGTTCTGATRLPEDCVHTHCDIVVLLFVKLFPLAAISLATYVDHHSAGRIDAPQSTARCWLPADRAPVTQSAHADDAVVGQTVAFS